MFSDPPDRDGPGSFVMVMLVCEPLLTYLGVTGSKTADWQGSRAPMGRVPPERALQIVTKAAQEANDVIQATQADPLKKPKQMKQATKDAVARCVESGDPAQVVAYIKANRKEFISGVYQSWFMKEIRKSLEGGQDGGSGGVSAGSGAQPPTSSSKRAVPNAADAAAPPAVSAKADNASAGVPPEKKRKTVGGDESSTPGESSGGPDGSRESVTKGNTDSR